MKSSGRLIPFTAIVGQEEMKKALILNVINPRIGGLLIRGGKGTAKSTAVRGLAELLPDIEVVTDCPFCCDPNDLETMCHECRRKCLEEDVLEHVKRKIRVINLPLGATEDRLVGTLDIERAIQEGVRAFDPGLLAAANRAILYVDEVNLMEDHIADLLLDSAALGVNIVEREGIQMSHPANFCLVGTMNPEEGEIRPQLLDRFGLQISVEGLTSSEERIAVVNLADDFDRNPLAFAKKFEPAQKEIANKIVRAIAILNEVEIEPRLVEMIVSICLEFGIGTHRAEIATLRACKAIAALDGRKEVDDNDVREALYLALPHRMRRKPFEPPVLDKKKIDAQVEDWEKKKHQTTNTREIQTRRRVRVT
jgi:Mg-chelatase subunit ChlI